MSIAGRPGSAKTPPTIVRRSGPLNAAQSFELAVSHHRASHEAEAEQLYRAILRIKPNHFGAVHYLGLLCIQRRQFDEALTLLQRAIVLNPRSPEARMNLGIVLAARSNWEKAILQYEAAIALQPDYADAHNNLGIALQGLQRQEDAAAQFRLVLALQPDNAFVHNNLGTALAALGRHVEAVDAYQRVIDLDSRIPEAFNSLGLSLTALDRHNEAIEQYQRAIALRPDYAEAHGNLGAALNKLDRHEEAISHFERALDINPRLAEAHNDIGNALMALKRHEEAVTRYRRALALKPDLAATHFSLANALVILNCHGQAIPHFKAALALAPDSFETLVNFGNALSHIEHHDEALMLLRRAVKMRPESAQVLWHLGSALEAAGRSEEAVASHRRALAIDPEFAVAYNTLGFSLVSLGHLAEARRAIEKAIELEPKASHFHRNLALNTRFAPDSAHLQAMEELARDLPSLPETTRMELQFALGKAYADLGRGEDALRQLIGANAIKRTQVTYDEATTLGQFNRIKQVMTRALIERKSGHGASTDVPIFILGMPRSGSTLIEQILASHPDVLGAGEIGEFSRAVAGVCRTENRPMLFTETIADLPEEGLSEIGTRYLRAVRALAPAATRITDKMPANFRMAGLIYLALPGARIIHSCRDPIDTCLSCFEREFTKDYQSFSYDLGELGRYYRAYDSLMTHWHDVLPAGSILDVHYEELVADFEPQVRRILAYCGLGWDERCLTFHRATRPIHTSSAAQVRQPVYGTSVGRGRQFQHLLRPLLEGLDLDA